VFLAVYFFVPFFAPVIYANEEGVRLFDDGVVYIIDTHWSGLTTVNILHEGEEINCVSGATMRGSLNPMCVEIIMRSIP
jgi:hypothetical protein